MPLTDPIHHRATYALAALPVISDPIPQNQNVHHALPAHTMIHTTAPPTYSAPLSVPYAPGVRTKARRE